MAAIRLPADAASWAIDRRVLRGVGPLHYQFKLYALDQMLTLPADATRADVMKAMDGHIVGTSATIPSWNGRSSGPDGRGANGHAPN